MKVVDQIRAYVVPKGSIAMWWLGQSGYIFKSPEGTLACVDAYLTNSVAGTSTALNLERRVPVLVAPEDVDVDVYFCTHSHMDHADPETIARLRQRDIPHFVGPHPVCDIYRQKGIESGRIVPAWPDCELEFKDLKMNGTFSLPTDMTDLNHMGYVIQFGSGPKVYITGDTDYSDLLLSAAKHEPQVMITVINAGFNNLSHFEAAEIAGKIKPKIAIPSHYDMFPDNSVDPGQFRASLALKGNGVAYQELKHFEAFVFEGR